MLALKLTDRIEPARMVRHYRRSRRIRLEVPRLPGDPLLAAQIERALKDRPGVEEIRADTLTGRVLVRYRGEPPSELLGKNVSPPVGLRERILRGLHSVRHRATRKPVSPAPEKAPKQPQPWHALPVNETLNLLRTSPAGLTTAEARHRLFTSGPNVTDAPSERSRFELLVSQFNNVPTLLLIGSAGVALLLGDVADAATITVVILLNGALGYVVERRNQDILASWRRLEAPTANVVRDGLQATVSAADLVPGDLLLLRAGDLVPADCRLIEAGQLTCDEAALTGESEPQEKTVHPVDRATALADRRSMLLSGTTVTSGSGSAVVTATGQATELAQIGRLLTTSRSPSAPLARRLERLGSRVAWTAAGAAGVVAIAGLLHGRPAASVLRATVALGVAAIPEGLPLVANAALVRSMQRLRDHGIIVRKLAAAESLGAVTVVCADKTGTLTCNEMRVEAFEVEGTAVDLRTFRAQPDDLFEDSVTLTLAALLLNSDVEEHTSGGTRTLSGSSTEKALVEAAYRAGLDGESIRARFPRLELRERSNGNRFVVSVHRAPDGGTIEFVKGAPEQVIHLCEHMSGRALDDADREVLLRRNERLAGQGLRVLAVGWRRTSGEDEGFHLLGLVGLGDPLREGAAEAVRDMARAGIRTVMVTGDQRRTAEAIARRIGLHGEVLTGREVAHIAGSNDPELLARLDRAAVIARVAPQDKLAIVEALQRNGEVVAMMGDGINDAPALKLADVGVAIGSRATDMARQVADMVLAGDDLRSILVAVAEGRGVHDNLHRSIRYLLATNLSELVLMAGAAALGRPEPLTPAQLLWINLMTDTLPGLALALDPASPDVLDQPPLAQDSLLPPELRRTVERDGVILGAAGAVGNILGGPPMAFSLLAALQIGYAGFCRAPSSLLPSVNREARFAGLVGAGAALQFAGLTVPALRRVLRVPPPTAGSLGLYSAAVLLPYALRTVSGRDRIHRYGPGPRRPALQAAFTPQESSP